MPRITSRFGTVVRSLRHRLGLTQEALAERAELHRTYIAGIEGGVRNVTLKTIEKLAHALHVSTATLLLDAVGAPARSELTKPPATCTAQAHKEILLVTDQHAEVKRMLLAFQQARIVNPVKIAYSGQEALDLLLPGHAAEDQLGNRPQLVLLDLQRAKPGAREVLQRLKADQQTRAIPVIMLMDDKFPKEMAEGQRMGADSYIVKPLNFDKIATAARQLGMFWQLVDQPPIAEPARG